MLQKVSGTKMKRVKGNRSRDKNDREFFDKFLDENYDEMLRVVYYVIGKRNVSKADIIVQQIFYEAYKHVKEIRRARDPKRKLYLIARKELRKAGNSSEEADDGSTEKDKGFSC